MNRKRLLAQRLAQWAKSNSNVYPWRKTSDPYHVLVAEMLLRKTRADQVTGVYQAFIKQFPSLQILANADTERIRDVVWSLGLAYRSKWIKDISRNLFDKSGNTIPCDKHNLESGIGKNRRYILNAIRCFAFGQTIPIFDVNVKRVLERVFSIKFAKSAHRDQSAWEIASMLVPEAKPKEYNWSIIDLGRLICTSRNPKCSICPLMELCDFAKANK